MFDRRYPNLCRIEDAVGSAPNGGWLHYEARNHLGRVSREICGRCPGLKCAFDRGSWTLFFYLGEPSRGVHRVRVFSPSGGCLTFMSHEIDQITRLIQSAKMPRAQKDAIAAQQERELQQAAAANTRHVHDCKRGDRKAMVKYVRERKGMHSGYRGSIVVDKKPKARAA